jgi:hypothetical protein
VEYRPELDSSRVTCLLTSTRGALGALSPGGSYSARYVQRGEESPVAYPLLILARPRLLGLNRRLVSDAEPLVVKGAGFGSSVSYLCQYRERKLLAGQDDGKQREFQPLFAPALKADPSEVTCPPIAEVPTYLREESGQGYRCLEIVIKDADSGLSFAAEPGSPAETLTSACLITDVDSLIASGPPEPSSLPLAAAALTELPPEERVLSFTLVEGSGILGLFSSLGEPLASAILRFDGIVVGTAEKPAELLGRSALASLASPVLLEIQCTANSLRLSCAPWPYVQAPDPQVDRTALTLVLSAPMSSPGAAIELRLSQELTFFQSIGVESWSPRASLLETVDSWVTVTGTGLRDSVALECLFFEVGLEERGPLARSPIHFGSSTTGRCPVPAILFRTASATLELHLSLDRGRTFEVISAQAPEPAMLFTLRPAPQLTKMQAFSAAGETISASVFVGRPEKITLQLEGVHLRSAEGRGPLCRFTSDTGRLLVSTAVIQGDGTARCDVPPVPRSLGRGLRGPGHQMLLSLYLEVDNAEFRFVPNLPKQAIGGAPAAVIALIPDLAVEALRVSLGALATS